MSAGSKALAACPEMAGIFACLPCQMKFKGWEVASYPELNAWMYSLDKLLPVIEIGQKAFRRPDPPKPGGSLAVNCFYFRSLVGWALSLLAIAGFSGLVKSA